jgi:DNA-binding CsgD family transcriptional regulator
MLNLFITGLFVVSAAFATGSITLVSQLRSKFRWNWVSTLLYMQVFYFMFGFYAIWGQLIIVSYLSNLIDSGTLNKISEISVLLGSPFIVFGWLMFLRFIVEFTENKNWKYFNSVFLGVNIIFLVVIGVLNSKAESVKNIDILKYYFLASNFIYSLVTCFLLIRKSGLSVLSRKSKIRLALGIALFMIAQNTSLYFYDRSIYVTLIFIFLFFAGTSFIPVFLKFNLKAPKLVQDTPAPEMPSFEAFCTKFEISPREKDIIYEICNGLTNQQIADKLFISLQTVKDHTHRIYGKTLATSRMQLMKMVQEVSGRK